MTLDVLVVGAGPAGSVAAAVLARRGARVLVVDRARFPRDKLCGDTVNPGALALLGRLGLAGPLEAHGLPIAGMIVTGAEGVVVSSPYPRGVLGRSMVRRDLDAALLERATGAGAGFEPGTCVRRALMDGAGRLVNGVVVDSGRTIRARVVIAADGRRSTLAFALRLARHPARPRRWAIGAYFEDVAQPPTGVLFGEMHVRPGGYIGVAPVPGGLTNVCLVRARDTGDRSLTGQTAPDDAFGQLTALLRRELAQDPVLCERFAKARLVTRPVVLGPLAVETGGDAIDGLLLAGDAAGFVDPMTGDGLRFAVRGGELAAQAALVALERGWAGVHAGLAEERRREFAGKLRFNRTLRALVASPAAVRLGEKVAAAAPFIVRAVVRGAGDCAIA